MWELSTDDIVTTLIVVCISALAIAWLFAGRRSPKKVDTLEAMRLAGREAEAYVAPVVSPQLAEIHVPTPTEPEPKHTSATVPIDSVLQLGEAFSPENVDVIVNRSPPPAEKKPLSVEQSNAISIAAALVRHDKRRPVSADTQNVEVCKSPVRQSSRAGGDDLTVINGIDHVLAGKLNDLGIHYYDQIAAWSPGHAGWIATQLGLTSENGPQGAWISHAQALADQSLETGSNRVVRRS